MSTLKETFKTNNFNLIRLIAAIQVAIIHNNSFLKVDLQWFLVKILSLLPGVPIFFFVSGFLISKSYENNSIISEYAINRILRIYPALIACFFISLLTVYLTGYFSTIELDIFQFLSWVAAQISFLQFYNPLFMRSFGSGVLNWSLWTISIELQFYLLVPVLYWLFTQIKTKWHNAILVALIFFFLFINIAYQHFNLEINKLYTENIQMRVLLHLWRMSFTPWFYMFLVGVFFQKNFDFLFKLLSGKFWLGFIIYLPVAYYGKNYLAWNISTDIQPIIYFLLAILIFTAAYSLPNFGCLLLNKNDISYGVYIYHVPIANLFIFYYFTGKEIFFLLALMLTILMAVLSWLFIEKPALKIKKHPLNKL